MTTAADVIHVAQSQVGYHETGGSHDDGNITKYWAELEPSLQGQPWCAGFVSDMFIHAGHPLPAIDHKWGFAAVANAYNYAKAHGLFDGDGHYQPGDVLLMKFSTGWHTGIVVSDDGHAIHTVEGNTSSDYASDQRNGGCVADKVRYHGPTVVGVLAASRLLAASPAKPKPAPKPAAKKHNPHKEPTRNLTEGAKDKPRYQGVAWVQWAVGAAEDGDFGPKTDQRVRAFQSSHRLAVDGDVGPKTRAAMRGVTK